MLEPGVDEFGDPDSEKILHGYELIVSSQSPDSSLAVQWNGYLNPSESPDITQSAVIKSPKTRNGLLPTLMANYIGDQISITGINNPLAITARVFRQIPVDSRGIGRIQPLN
jgi:hypothetical protein